MELLLDTHVFLWWIRDDKRLSEKLKPALGDSGNDLFLSAASSWEIAIKARSGKLKLSSSPAALMARHLAPNGIRELAITSKHALATYELPLHSRDPFDRLLVAQAQVERLSLVTADSNIHKYDVETIAV